MTATITHRQEIKDEKFRGAYVPVPDKPAQVKMEMEKINDLQDRMREQMMASMGKTSRVCKAQILHKQALKFGDLTELQHDCLMGLTKKAATASEVEERVGIEKGRARSPLAALVWRGYAKVGWRKGKRVWTRTDKEAEGEA